MALIEIEYSQKYIGETFIVISHSEMRKLQGLIGEMAGEVELKEQEFRSINSVANIIVTDNRVYKLRISTVKNLNEVWKRFHKLTREQT